MQTTKTTIQKLESPRDTSLVSSTDAESFNAMSLETNSNVNSPVDNSKPLCHWGSGYNSEQSEASMSGRIFVLSYSGKPLTPCKTSKARKLLVGGVAKVVWNKFGMMGIQMLIPTREETPKTVLGQDWGSKYEGYSLIVGNQNLLNVMWLLPDRKVLVRKMEERKNLRRARRLRNCRKRPRREYNRNTNGYISPSQFMMVNSRLKCIKEFFKCYPISKVSIENTKSSANNKNGSNFSIMEIGKNFIFHFIKDIIGIDNIILFNGKETKEFRDEFRLIKSQKKSIENFNSHCVDSFVLANKISYFTKPNYNILVIDDSYRSIRRRLHDSSPKKYNIREKYSTGNFKGIRKGTICEFGQIVGGYILRYKSKNSYYARILPFDKLKTAEKRISKNIKIFNWLSHNFKTKFVSGYNN